MDWFAGIVVYLITWWVVLFAVLPWGVRVPEKPEVGHAPSAPVNPQLGRKVLATTLISAVIWLIIHALISAEVFSFREWAATMR